MVYCLGVTPDLCNQMHATLDPKNEVVLNTFKAAFDSRTYVQFYELVNRAAHGDLQAREAAGELLAGILLAGILIAGILIAGILIAGILIAKIWKRI